MFPFDLAGPLFLVFYLAVGVALLGLATYAIRNAERAAGEGGALLTDPYEIAYMRGGATEAIKVAVLSLIDRGLLRHETDANGAAVLTPGPSSGTKAAHPLERAVMARVAGPTYPESLTGAALQQSAAGLVAPGLAARGLIADGPVRARRIALLGGAWAVLTLLFIARLVQALANQRSNVWLLVLLWIVAGVAAWALVAKLPHVGAANALGALASLLGGLRQRITHLQPGRATSELMLLAAVFGFWAVPEAMAPYANDLSLALTPRPPQGGSDGGGGSGCGSGGGGGSCGGGGGGCGGCGGG